MWLLERLHDLAAAQGRMGSVLEVQALQALALQAVGDQTAALAALAEALALGWPEGYVRVFVDEGHPWPPCSAARRGRSRARHGRRPGATRLPGPAAGRVRASRPARAGAPKTGGAVLAGLIEPLSARELEVLQLLAAGS